MVNSYYGIYQAERGKTAAEIRAGDAQRGEFVAALGQLGSALAAPGEPVFMKSLIRSTSASRTNGPDSLNPLTG